MKGVFREVVPPARLVFSNIAVDKDGNHLLEGETTVILEEQGGKTKLTCAQLRQGPGADRAADAGRHGGGLEPEPRQDG